MTDITQGKYFWESVFMQVLRSGGSIDAAIAAAGKAYEAYSKIV